MPLIDPIYIVQVWLERYGELHTIRAVRAPSNRVAEALISDMMQDLRWQEHEYSLTSFKFEDPSDKLYGTEIY